MGFNICFDHFGIVLGLPWGLLDSHFSNFGLAWWGPLRAEAEDVVEAIHEGFKKRHAEMRDILIAGCAERRGLAVKPYDVAADFIKTLVKYTNILEDNQYEEHDPLASRVLALRIDESTHWLNALFSARRGAAATRQL